MTYARKSLISLQDTPYYHVVARCVRRAWLWGVDEYAGKDYSHRKDWVIERLAQLSEVFAIDVCAYADPARENRCWAPGILIRLNEVCGSQSLA